MCVVSTRSRSPSHVARREAAPRVRRVLGRMRAAVHIDRSVRRAQPLGLERDDLPRRGIDFLPDAQVRRAALDVGGRVRPALPFGQRLDRRVPDLGAANRFARQRDADVLAEMRVVDVVLRQHDGPFAGEVHLRARRCRSRRCCDEARNREARSADCLHVVPPQSRAQTLARTRNRSHGSRGNSAPASEVRRAKIAATTRVFL